MDPLPSLLTYEIQARSFVRELSQEAGRRLTLADIPEAIVETWAARGFTHVWLMGVWPTGPKSRAASLRNDRLMNRVATVLSDWKKDDVGGSPYAISDYRVARSLGGERALIQFRKQLARHGLKLILDFIPNHTGLDHPWAHDHPEYFVQATEAGPEAFAAGAKGEKRFLCHGRDPFFSPWMDTLQLDFRRSDTRQAVLGQLEKVAQLCDGVRCDMAMLVLNEVFDQTWEKHPCPCPRAEDEFWPSTIHSVRSRHPGFLFIAEVYWQREKQLHEQGFDFCYRKGLTDLVLNDQPAEAQSYLFQLNGAQLPSGFWFLENHDEARVADQLTLDQHRAAVLLLLSLPGMRLLHEGQLSGFRIGTPVELVRRPSEPADPKVAALYQEMLAIARRTEAGTQRASLLAPRPAWNGNLSHLCMVLFIWQRQPDEFFISVVNLGDQRAQCYVTVPVAELEAHGWKMEDLLGTERYIRHGPEMRSGGLYLDVPGRATQLFQFTPVAVNRSKNSASTKSDATDPS